MSDPGFLVDGGFRGNPYRLEPDYSRSRLRLDDAMRDRIRGRLRFLYGPERLEDAWSEVERVLAVHHAHATDDVLASEARFDPLERFTEKDVILITYGDLITSRDRGPLRTLGDFARIFFRDIITTLHILPFFPYSSDRGFSVVSYEDVDPHLGTWEDIGELEKSFKLMFDGVVNHISAKSRWFQEFLNGNPDYQDFFICFSAREALDDDRLRLILRPRTSSVLSEFDTFNGPRWVWTTFSQDQIDLNFQNPKVMVKILEILLGYVRRGADLIRLDAITYLWSELGTSCAHLEQTHEVVKLFRDCLDVVAPHVGLITETNVPHADNITYFGNGEDEAQMVYNFALPPLVLYTFMTGDTTVLSHWARDLVPPSDTTHFFNFLDSHDGVGVMGARGILPEEEIQRMADHVVDHGGFVSNKSNSDGTQSPYELNITWYSALNKEDNGEPLDLQVARFIASRAVALVLRGVPGIYLLSMFGSRNDVDAALRDGVNRSINRSALDERQLFEAFGDRGSPAAKIARRYVDMLERRVERAAFHPRSPQTVLDLGPGIFGVIRRSRSGTDQVISLINVTDHKVAVTLRRDDVGGSSDTVQNILTERQFQWQGDELHLTVAPYAVLWLVDYDETEG
jgi:glycosidase